jgi:DNA invertase Pin-like site-specific DNA recombinase
MKGEHKANIGAVGYIRVSTELQAEKGLSLEAQTEKIKAMAQIEGVALREIIVDAGKSAKNLERPGMIRLRELLKMRSVTVVIVAKLDRLTRSIKDLAELLEQFQKHGVALVSVAEKLDTASASGRMVLNVMMAVSQWEREAVSERTRAVVLHKKAQRRAYCPSTPYGFRQDGDSLVEDSAEMRIVQRLHRLKRRGWSLRRIADRLNRENVPTRRNGRWFASTVRYILGNDIYNQKDLC